jgi:hypothetical protein
LGEEEVVAMGRPFLPRTGVSEAAYAARVVEPELDMHRPAQSRPSAILERMSALIRWMVPGTVASTELPMRSIDRELWETSNDR